MENIKFDITHERQKKNMTSDLNINIDQQIY